MSDPFVGPVPMRWEFDTLLNNLSAAAADLDTERPPDRYVAARADVCRAFDAQAARIAELDPLNKRIVLKLHDIVNRNPLPEGSLGENLEDVIDRQITALMRENELLGQHNAKLQGPAHRARIAREFLDAVDAEWFSDGKGSMDEIRDAVLERWEAAAKEGE